MTNDLDIAAIGKLLGDPARVNMLGALMGGLALPAGELARAAGVTAQTASMHLAKLTAGGLIASIASGRHRYFSLASADIAHVIETLMLLTPPAQPRTLSARLTDVAMRRARTCYDHLAGALGVALTQRMLALDWLEPGEHEFRVTQRAIDCLQTKAIDTSSLTGNRRCTARRCIDWTERRPHVAGAFGALLADWLLRERWLARMPATRALRITERGLHGFKSEFEIDARHA